MTFIEEASNSDLGQGADLLFKVTEVLQPILSPRQPIDTIEKSFKTLSTENQNFCSHWVAVVAVSNIELAYVFASEFGSAQKRLDRSGLKVWLNESLALYDREGLYPAIKSLQNITAFKQRYTLKRQTCTLEEVKPKLDVFIRGLAGRALTVKSSEIIYTDTEHLYLPRTLSRFRDKQQNATLYKAIACFLWAQTWYGTFKRTTFAGDTTQKRLENYKNPNLAKRYFLSLENIRLLANIERDLPGLYREMNVLSPLIEPNDKTWRVITKRLKQPEANVEDTFLALDNLLRLSIHVPEVDYQGDFNFEEVALAIMKREKGVVDNINKLLSTNDISEQQLAKAIEAQNKANKANEGSDLVDNSSLNDEETYVNTTYNQELNKILASLSQDISQLALDNFNGSSFESDNSENRSKPPFTQDFEADAYFDEWDYLRQNYREDWCRIRTKIIEPIEDNFKQQTQQKYPYLLNQIRKAFEAMRDQARFENRQTDGEEIDLEAVVEMHTARLAGEELSERMYIRRQNNERDVAVCLLVDMSGSTKGWINLTMRESLVFFSEALNTLGDQYAILGFSGLTRQRCEIYSVKQFTESNPELINNRISNIKAKDYTRMGFAIRYATRELNQIQSKHRILLLLTDGKPDDYDGYQGEYGIQDTRKAILEAQAQGVKPFSITIDKQAQTYLPRLFGPGRFVILNKLSTLPVKLTEIYRKLSS